MAILIIFFSWCRISPTINFSHFLSILGTSSNHFLFSGFSDCRSTKKIVILFFFSQPFNLPIWAALGKTIYSLHHRHVCLLRDLLTNWLVWFFLFADLTFSLPHITKVSWSIDIQPSDRSLVARDYLPVHTPILGKLVNRSACTLDPNSTLQTSHLLLWVCKGNKKREREKKREWESIFMSKIWIWLLPGSKFITMDIKKWEGNNQRREGKEKYICAYMYMQK